jgi:6-phosphogluconolactonase
MKLLPIAALVAAGALAASAADFLMYVGTYTGPASKGIYVYRFDAATAKMTSLGLAAASQNPAYLAIRPGGDYLYAVNEVREGRVSTFRADRKSGKLTPVGSFSSRGDGPCALSVDPSGKYVMAANYGSGSVALYRIKADGSLEEAGFDQHTGKGADPKRQEGPHAHAAIFSPDGRYALSADLGVDRIYVYRVGGAASALEALEPARLAPGSGPRHLEFHPNGKFVYSINELTATVTAFAWNAGALTEIETVPALPAGYAGPKSGAEIAIHPNGGFLYVSTRGDSNDIAVFAIDAAKGTLTLVEHVASGGRNPRYIGFDATGEYLVAANQETNNVVVFRVNAKTGKLTDTGMQIGIGAPVCVKFAPAE